jgi:membrane protein
MIVSLGFLLMISLLLDSLLTFFFDKLENTIGTRPSILLEVTSSMTTLAIVFVVILLVFKVLPDVRLRWRDVSIAALLTTGLLMLGNLLISWYIGSSDFSETYAAAGSVIIILIWVYYSTLVLLFGAEITRAVMIYRGRPIRPAEGAKKIYEQKLDYEAYQAKK